MRRHVVPLTVALAAQRISRQRGTLVFTGLFYALVASVIAQLWRAAAGANGGEVAGYSAAGITWYLMASEAVTIALPNRLIADVTDDVISGAVAVELLRPVSALRQRVLTQIGTGIPRLMMCALIGLLLSIMVVGKPVNGVALALAVPSMLLAVSCNIVAQHAFASAAFWLRETGATWFLYQKLVFTLGGVILPLQALPSSLRTCAFATPFPAMAYAPARLASGHVEPELLVMQAGWLVVLYAVAALVFGAGERQLQVVGG